MSWTKLGRAEILFFISGRAGLGPKFQFPFRAGPGSGLNFNFSFGPGRARAEIFSLLRAGLGRDCSHAVRSGPGLKNLALADL